MKKPPSTAQAGCDEQSSHGISDVSWPTASSPLPEEGARLVRTFLKIKSPTLRRAVVKFVDDLARMDEAEKRN